MNRERIAANLDRMRNIACPKPGTYAVAPLQTSTMPDVLTDVLRVFRAIDPAKGRRPSLAYDPGFDKFEHVLSDSPTTIAARMNGRVEDYTSHAICQIGVCNFRCFYCYVDYRFLTGKEVVHVSADQILKEFLTRREELKQKGVALNVLRISGGEPLLAPDLVLQCLRLVKELGLASEVCIKTETNLSPLIPVDGRSRAEEWADFTAFKEFNNFIMHPTFHGVDVDSLQRISGASYDTFDLIDALGVLVAHRIEFFPSFGANVIGQAEVEPFFHRLRELHPLLPLRAAIRKFNLQYEAPSAREQGSRDVRAFDHVVTITEWDRLLRQHYGVEYGQLPRHTVALYSPATRAASA